MKKEILIIAGAAVLIAGVLFVPIPSATYKDGGTKEYKALTYKMVKWNRIYEGDLCYNSTRFYFGKEKNKSIDELWEEINPTCDPVSEPSSNMEVMEMDCTIEKIDGTELTVSKSGEESGLYHFNYGSLDGSADMSFDVGDVIHVRYLYPIEETYPMGIPNIVEVEKVEAGFGTDAVLTIIENGETIKLKKEDGDAIRGIIASPNSWGPSYDNISDIKMEIAGKTYYYDFSSGIITENDDKAVKLDEKAKEKLNKIITDNIPVEFDEIIIEDEETSIVTTKAERQTAVVGDPTKPVSSNGSVMVGHTNRKAYLSEADARYIKSVIDSFEVTACALFSGNKEYVIHLSNTAFGGNAVYYDSSSGELGNSSIGYLNGKEKEKFDSILKGYFNGSRQGSTIKDSTGLITDTFLVKKVNGTELTLTRYDRKNGEYKEGLYTCNYGKLDGSDAMKFNVGDVVTIRYDNIMETYPMQISVKEIYIAGWN